jgi:galactose oxidase-like protein/carboxypeptidase family protein/Kelch motif protein
MRLRIATVVGIVFLTSCAGEAATRVSGQVTSKGVAVQRARVTLVGGSFFAEARTDASGGYELAEVPAGSYALGVSAPGLEYQEAGVQVAGGGDRVQSFALSAETQQGRWDVLADLDPERFGGTNSGVLLPDGRLMYCHNTLDPVIYDPVSGQKSFPAGSPRLQGCHAVSVLWDGRLLYVGGADQPVFGPGTRQVKTYDPVADRWDVQPDLRDWRWYPTMAPLPGGGFVTAGGGGLQNPVRVKTSEVLDPNTMQWASAGEIALGNEVSPVVMLFTGEVLMTHRPPQLFNPGTRRWRPAADFVQGNRMANGDHADHEMVLLSNGRAVAVGFKSFQAGQPGNIVERYDPVQNQWSLGANMKPVRSRASIVLLPDERVLVMGGAKEDPNDPTPVNAWGYTALTDLYDPKADAWRRLASLNVAREYHAMPIVVPDGRVLLVGGEGQPGVEPDKNIVEAFSPPYLFRGPRPDIVGLTQTTYRRGESIAFDVAKTAQPTRVILLGAIATTHFMDSGPGRMLDLPFTQQGTRISAAVPAESAKALYGYYLLFVMVDDIPSAGRIVRIVPGSLAAAPSMSMLWLVLLVMSIGAGLARRAWLRSRSPLSHRRS